MSAGMFSRNPYPISCCNNGLRSTLATGARSARLSDRDTGSVPLQLGFLGMTGTTLRSLEYVPGAVLRHLGRQFRQPAPDIATLRTLYRRRPTRFAHHRWAIKQWGLREFDPAIEHRLTEHIHSRTNGPRASGCIGPTWPFRAVVRLRFLFAALFNPLRSKIIAICGDT